MDLRTVTNAQCNIPRENHFGDRILKSRNSVWETMATEWCRECLFDAERDSMVNAIKAVLPAA
jgi:hypothetical protein